LRSAPATRTTSHPGHDAWVVGDEPYVGIDFSDEMAEYAKPS
jgi:hypothetical protein